MQDFIGKPDLVVTASEQLQYRPFKSAEEVLAAIKEHGDYVRIKDATALERNTVIIDVDYMSVHAMGHRYKFEEALKEFDFSDGTPFGIKED